MDESQKELFQECERRLLKAREEVVNGLQALSGSLSEKVEGDEGDIAQVLQSQHTSMVQREKLIFQMREIEDALQRIQEGSYGVCEETEEPIERERLLAIPWTRLSLIGAEMRESRRKRFA